MNVKVLSWNIRYKNKKAFSVIQELIKNENPDIFCLQEVPDTLVAKLRDLKEFHMATCVDFTSLNGKDNTNMVTLSKMPFTFESTFTLHEGKVNTLYSKFFYTFVAKVSEHFDVIETAIKYGDKEVTVYNAHLPCSTGPLTRINQLEKILERAEKKDLSIICGDMNIMDPVLVNSFSGIFRGFLPKEFFLNERKQVTKIIEKYRFSNIFEGTRTASFTPIPYMQSDHILVPDNVKIIEKKRAKQKGSDHLPIATVLSIS